MGNMMKILIKTKQNAGSVLLIAVLMSAVVLAVGVGVYQRSYKELVFSSTWRQTQIAFGSADAGYECALYWDLHQPAVNATCFGATFPWGPVPNPGDWSTYRSVGSGCVNIHVNKTFDIAQNRTITTIQSRGYNDACGSTNPRRVERALQISY